MKDRVEIFAKRIGSPLHTLNNIDKETLIKELSPFVLPRKDGKAGLLVEEVEELIEAVKDGNVSDILDAVVDTNYFLLQMILWLEKAGIKYETACDLVCDNNDDKYTDDLNFIENKLLEWKENDPWFASQLRINTSVVGGKVYYCLKDQEGKVRKFVDFPKVNLNVCIPEELL